MWKCPHGEDINTKAIGGLMIYYHADGKQCDLLNSFDVDISAIDDVTYRSDPKKYWFELCDCKSSLKDIIKALEDADQIELTKLLDDIVHFGLIPYIGDRLGRAFGQVLVRNLEIVGAGYNALNIVRQAANGVKPRHKMQYLSQASVKLSNILGKE